MLIFTYKLCKYIKSVLIPKLLLNPSRYAIKGSFRRKIPYITDIDIVSNTYPEINQDNLYQKLVELIVSIKDDFPDIILTTITCGTDERFKFTEYDDDKIKEIKKLINPSNALVIDHILNKYSDESKRLFFINEIIWNHYKLRWTPDEVEKNEKILPGNKIVHFTDIISDECTLLMQYYVRVNSYYINFDVVNNYKKCSVDYVALTDYQIKYANYYNEYYYMLFPFRYYFKSDKKIRDRLEYIIEKKFGLYKQLMVQIGNYHDLFKNNHLNDEIASSIIKNIINDSKYLPSFKSNCIKKIKEISLENSPDKIEKWNTALNVLYDEINMTVNTLAKKYFFEFLKLIPKDQQHKYYLTS